MGTKKPELIFLFRLDLNADSLRQYGYYQLRERFDVIGCNLSLLIDGVTPERPAGELITIPSYGEFERFIKEHARDAVFVDHIKGRTEIDLATEKVFRLLKKHNARYVIMVGGAVPVGKSIGARARKMASPRKLLSFLFRKVVGCMRKAGIVYSFPDIVFGCDTDALSLFCEKRGIKYIPSNSWDYDRYLDYAGSSARGDRPAARSTAIYIDEALCCAADFKINDFLTVDPGTYYKSLNGFFDLFEKRTGVRVEVAAHPKSDPELLRKALGGRAVHAGKTVELIAGCDCVFAHWSTAVSFAVLFDKPLALLNNGAIKATSLQYLLENMASSLKVPVLDVDDEAAVGRFEFDPAKWSRAGYNGYKTDFIRHPDAPDLPSWRIMGDAIMDAYFNDAGAPKDLRI